MNLNKFKRGDILVTKMGNKARVLDIVSYNPIVQYKVKITNNMNTSYDCILPEDSLNFPEFYQEKKSTIIPPSCPKCGLPWKKTYIGTKVFMDCENCNDKAENLVDKYYQSKGVSQYDSLDELDLFTDDEWNDMLSEFDKWLKDN